MNTTIQLYSIIIPVFNSSDSLEELVTRIDRTMKSINSNYEIILVNDNSYDTSWEVIKKLKKQYPNIRGYNLLFNSGQNRALMCGFENSKGDFMITMDDDLQNPPEEIISMTKAINENQNIDCIFGIPQHKQHNFFRNLGTTLNQILFNLILNKNKKIKTSTFRIFNRRINDAIIQHKTYTPTISGLILKITKKILNIPVRHEKRKYGKSNYNTKNLIILVLDNLINFSTFPLKTISVLGIISSILSVILSAFYFILFLMGQVTQPGWITLILLVTFYFGLVLFSVGLIGEYLIRIINEVSKAPKYLIKEKV
jgi:glycosyltransferase involved in cell wall biosynthesis